MEYLIHGKGIYDSEAGQMRGTGLAVRDGLIVGRGDFEELSGRYKDASVLDYSDEYVLPGLINTHVHLEFAPSEDTYGTYMRESAREHVQRADSAARKLLLSGVTTVRDAGSSMETVRRLRGWEFAAEPPRRSAGERFWGRGCLPRLQLCGVPLTVTGGHLSFLGKPSDTEEEIFQAVEERAKSGCTCIKIIASGGQLTPGWPPEKESYGQDLMGAAVRAAHGLGLPTAAHCLTTKSYVNAMEAGVDSVEHCACFVRNERLGLLERKYEPGIMERFRGDGRFFMIGFSNHYHKLDVFRRGDKSAPEAEAFLLEQEERESGIFKCLVELGMRPVVGTDGGCGFTYFDETWLELELLNSRCGLTPGETIHAATVSGARALGYGERLGKLTPGFYADVITLKQNPLEDILAFRNVSHVICRGELVK